MAIMALLFSASSHSEIFYLQYVFHMHNSFALFHDVFANLSVLSSDSTEILPLNKAVTTVVRLIYYDHQVTPTCSNYL